MAAVEVQEEFAGKIEKVFGAVTKFELYPKYLPGVTGIKVHPPKMAESFALVRYELNIVKTFYYELNMYQEAPNKIWWDLNDSNLMKANNGSWTFKSAGKDKTKAIYQLDIKFKGLIPSMITDQIAKANLPLMMSGFQRLIAENS